MDIVVWRKEIVNPKSVVQENCQGFEALCTFGFSVNNFYPFQTHILEYYHELGWISRGTVFAAIKYYWLKVYFNSSQNGKCMQSWVSAHL